MTKKEHVYAIFFRTEVVCDVIYGRNVKTIESYLVVNFEVAGANTFRDIKKDHFVMVAADIDDSKKRKRIRVTLNYLVDSILKLNDCLLNTKICYFVSDNDATVFGNFRK